MIAWLRKASSTTSDLPFIKTTNGKKLNGMCTAATAVGGKHTSNDVLQVLSVSTVDGQPEHLVSSPRLYLFAENIYSSPKMGSRARD